MANVELYGASTCPYTRELREQLRWRRVRFTEYDVEQDAGALARLEAALGAGCGVPVVMEDGRVTEIGWRGRTCLVGSN
jgi:glutaredoxin